MRIILMGPPGSGKGTQADIVRAKYNIVKLSSGDIFRSLSRDNSELSKKVKYIMDQGKLLPDSLVTEVIIKSISEIDHNLSFILDGFPRTINQALYLDNYLEKKQKPIDYVINLQISDELLIKRISGRITCKACGASFNKFTNPTKILGKCDNCGSQDLIVREDDNENSVKTRMQEYYNQTRPLLEYYKEKGLLVNIDASQEMNKVTDGIIQAISKASLVNNLKNSNS